MDLRLEEAELVKQRVEEAGIAFMAEFPRRHAPATLRLKELIATRLGSRGCCSAISGRWPTARRQPHAPPAAPSAAATSWNWSIGAVTWWIASPRVFGVMHAGKSDPAEEDYQMMSLDFSEPSARQRAGGADQLRPLRSPHWQEAITYRPLPALQVSCERGIAFVDLPLDAGLVRRSRPASGVAGKRAAGGRAALDAVSSSVTSLVRKTNDLEDAYRAPLIVEEARRTQEEGRRVEF